MNPLPRFLGLALFVVLAILTALVAAPVWQRAREPHARASSVAAASPAAAPTSPQRPTPAKLADLSQRAVLALGLLGLALAGALVFTLASRSHSTEPRPTYDAARQEIGALTKLAETSAAQGEALSRERDVRRRAEQDAELKQELLAQSLEEKIQLGRDLHDGIIQSLYAVGLTLEAMRPMLQADPAKAEQRLDEVRSSLNAAIRDVRTYITGLAPENLRRASFSRSIAALFEQLSAGRDAKFEITIDEDAAAILSVDQNVEALQIAREAISNALRHGHATQLIVRLHKGENEVGLLVQDNGSGFHADRSRDGGRGLANMRARAERLGASLRVTSQPGQGTRVIATFPATAA